MASAVYPGIRQQLVAWALGANAPAGLAFHVIGVDTDYVYNSSHVNLVSVAPGDIVLPEKALTGVTYAGGILDAADPTWTGLTPGATVKALIVYLKSGANTWLVAYLDDTIDSSLPLVIASSSVTLTFNAAGICKL